MADDQQVTSLTARLSALEQDLRHVAQLKRNWYGRDLTIIADRLALLLGEIRQEQPQSEVCLCAALLMADGYTFRGHRHDDCYLTMGDYERYTKADGHKAKQGFLTSRGRFVTRSEAAALHSEKGKTLLFSEDLY